MLDFLSKLARIGNRILSIIAGIFVILMLMYGGYSLWDAHMNIKDAFVSEELLKYKPFEDEKESLEDLCKINSDIFGWIEIKDTHIDYPVVLSQDNQEYVNLDIYKEFSLSGAIFLDARNTKNCEDNYNIIYGHHMEQGGMFGDLDKYLDKEFFDKHLTGTLITLNENYDLEVFACVEANSSDDGIYCAGQLDRYAFRRLIQHIQSKALIYRDGIVEENDKIVALSTCSSSNTNGRIVVYAKMIKK